MKLFLALMIISVLISNVLLIQSHEQVHQVIFKYYGVESVVEPSITSGFVGLETKPLNSFESGEKRESAYLLHSMNEIFGYQIMMLFNAFVIFTFFSMFFFNAMNAKGIK